MNAQIERIKKMEGILEEGTFALNKLNEALDNFIRLKSDIKELQYYYENGGWEKDFKDDEAGLLPKELKRGVLSEDSLYNFLEEIDELKTRIRL